MILLVQLLLFGGVTMTELRKRMIECLQLRGLFERTQEAYVRALRQLAEHYHKSSDLISEEELRQYFLFIKNVKHYSRNTMTIAAYSSGSKGQTRPGADQSQHP